jgi:prolipoprotein diacylglyceryl transferase
LRASIPTPTISAIEIGPLTIHFYALCIIAGVAVAISLGNLRFSRRDPGLRGVVQDISIWAIPAGVIGGRIYHVATSPDRYFGAGGSPIEVFAIWNGGLGIWGAISLGALAAFVAYKRSAKSRALPSFAFFADALAPGLLLAQAIGRWGNWFNGELFGRPLDAPWSLEIPRYLRPAGFEQFTTFHPTFLYESLWCIAIAITLMLLSTSLKPGSLFWLYVAAYSAGRFFIESLRIDEAHSFAGLRLNQYVATLITLGACVAFTKNQRTNR